MENYKLDPINFNSLPGFSWQACLRFTKAEPEYLHDPNMYMFYEQGIRGGVSVVSKRYADTSDNQSSIVYFGK